jgi:hypothetical protein
MFVYKHFDKFKSLFEKPPEPPEVEGKNPQRWFANVDHTRLGEEVDQLPASPTNRAKLLAMATKPAVRTLDLSISILAWGGMQGNHRDKLFGRPPQAWIEIADRIRGGKLTRSEAYDEFAWLRKNGELPGMGPAYFTKLIYFLAPETAAKPKGYIMDQWVACSVNLLTGRQVVKLDETIKWKKVSGRIEREVNSTVSDVNTGEDYEACCRSIEAISKEMNSDWDPEKVELALLAEGGRNPHGWRKYVVEERLAKFCAADHG